MPKATDAGTPDAGDPHVRCDGGQVARLHGAAPCLPYRLWYVRRSLVVLVS